VSCFYTWESVKTNGAQFGQELLSTFGTTLGEVALIPATGPPGLFTIHLVRELYPSGPQQLIPRRRITQRIPIRLHQNQSTF
jgi:predicted Rdx family selenoprotein